MLHLDNPRAVCLPDHGPAAGHAGFTEGSEEARLMKEVFRATGTKFQVLLLLNLAEIFFKDGEIGPTDVVCIAGL